MELISDGYQTTDVWYKWNPRDDNTSAIYVNPEVELPQFELASVEKETDINQYNIGNYAILKVKKLLIKCIVQLLF